MCWRGSAALQPFLEIQRPMPLSELAPDASFSDAFLQIMRSGE